MAAVQHVYQGEGEPNGVITDAAVGSHYIDRLTYSVWQAIADEGETGWKLMADGGALMAIAEPQTVHTFNADYVGAQVFEWDVTLQFEASGTLLSNVQMTVESGLPTYVTTESCLVEVRPIYSGGRLVIITPVFAPVNPA